MTGAKGIALVYPNVSHSGESFNDSAYVKSIDSIESRAGFDFFSNVPSAFQTSAESNTSWSSFTSTSNISTVTGNNWGSF